MIRLLATNTHIPVSVLPKFVLIFTLALILFPIDALAESDTFFFYAQDGPRPIQDNGGFEGRTMWEIDLIDLSEIPSNAIITSVDIEYWINHTWVGDLKVWLTTEHKGEWRDHVLWDREGGSADDVHEKETGLTTWSGWPANRKWYLCAADYVPRDEGEISQWKIWVHFDSPTVTPQSIPYYQDFESGRPGKSQGWEYYSGDEGRIEVVNGQLRMDDTADGFLYSLNEGILHLDLSERSGVILTLDHVSSRDEDTGLPSSFTNHLDGDGIAISADGINWYLLTNLTSDFENQSFDLDAVVQAAGIKYTSDFRIKFQQYDNYSWPMDGRAFDNISVTATGADPYLREPFGTWEGTFDSVNYGVSGTISNWIMRDDYTTESKWELHVEAGTKIRISPSGTYSFNPVNDRLDFLYTGLASIWTDGQITNVPCILDVNGTIYRRKASGSYGLKLFPPNLPPVIDAGTWQVSRLPNIALHVFGIEMCVGWNYNDPDLWDDLTYDFRLGLETDDTVSHVEFLTPAGYTFQIPSDVHTQTGDVQTWHYTLGTVPLEKFTSGLVAHWKMDDNAANTTVVDSSDRSNHGTARRNTSTLTTAGRINNALTFDGTNDSIVVPDRDEWTFDGDFTITLWVKLNKLNLKWWEAAFIAQDEGPHEKNKWIFSYDPGENKTTFHINGPSPVFPAGGYVIRGNPWAAQTGVWYFIGVSRTGNIYTFYRQGIADGSEINSTMIPDVAAPLTIGWAEGSAALDGAIDDVRIFSRALSDTEMRALYEHKRNMERWDYLGKFTNMDALSDYGDGTYTITVHYKDGTQDQTTALFGVPETTNAIPQPTEQPVLVFPEHKDKTTSPVTFTWRLCDDINATSMGLRLEQQDTGEYVDIELPTDATSSDPIPLSPGIWQAKVFCERWYDFNSPVGIATQVGKYSESDYRFEISDSIIVAYWKMDDNAPNTTVVDSSGNGNHGTAQRNTSTLTTPGKINSALSFNGINDYVVIPRESNLITGTNDFTIAGWFNLNNVSSVQNLIAWTEPSSAVQFVITDGAGNTGIWADSRWIMSTSYPFLTGTWYHIAWIRNGNAWELYINGTQIGPNVIDGISLGMPMLDYHIGAEATAPSQFLSGLLDDIRIYNRALTKAEINTLYNDQIGI